MAIERLMLLDTVNGGTYIAANVNSQDYRITVDELTSFIEEQISPDSEVVRPFITQYASPVADSFNVAINSQLTGRSVHLILTPTTGFAAGAITLPITPGATDKQEVVVNCTQQVTALTIVGNGAGVVGAPSSLGADDFFRLKYDLPTTNWYRIG